MAKKKSKGKKDNNPSHRPSKYDDHFLNVIRKLFAEGKTQEEVATYLGVHVNTLKNWKNKHAHLLSTIKDSKDLADDMVEAALFTRAVGFSKASIKIFSYEGNAFEHEYVEQVPADPQAAIFWLKNRRPEIWKDKQEIKHDGAVAGLTVNYARKNDKKE